MFDISFKNENCKKYGIIPVRRPSIPAPERKIREVEIPGRDGVLIIDNKKYNPITIPIDFNFLVPPDKWGDTFRKAKRWLTGNGELLMSDDTEGFYKVYYCKITSTERTSRKVGNFTADFVCDPYFYFTEGKKEIVVSGDVYNPGMECAPLYRISGEGNCTLTVNGYEFSMDIGQEIIIDPERMISYKSDNTDANTDVTGDYERLYLIEGDNMVTATAGFTVNMMPRWRTI